MNETISPPDFTIRTLGPCDSPSPLQFSSMDGDYIANYVTDEERILVNISLSRKDTPLPPNVSNSLEPAGPRSQIYFDPETVHAAIVTCGGLCPGLNDVIRAIVLSLHTHYGVRRISGIRYGYRGLITEMMEEPATLTPEFVKDIHHKGGTILGSSRGHGERVTDIVNTIEQRDIRMLFTIGGDGTQNGARHIAQELRRRNRDTAVIGIPKTIDNDIDYADRSFGFDSAVAAAVNAISAAHIEAVGVPNGIGLVKVMGRHSGFIACHAALSMNDVDFVLIPEVPFALEGENGFLAHLEKRLQSHGHGVVLLAEGAGQQLLPTRTEQQDLSGNVLLGDIGLFLKTTIETHFRNRKTSVHLKYIDPSYIIRATPANASDSLLCARLGGAAVHAAMCGKTELLINILNNQLIHIPISMAIANRKQVNPDGSLWRDVVEATGQPTLMCNPKS